jgi:hypothetical protein
MCPICQQPRFVDEPLQCKVCRARDILRWMDVWALGFQNFYGYRRTRRF